MHSSEAGSNVRMSDQFVDIKTAAGRLGVTERHLRRLCVSGRVRGACKNGRRWLVPASYDQRLTDPDAIQKTDNTDVLSSISAEKRDEAMQRLGTVQQFERFAASFDGKISDALSMFAGIQGVGERTLWRWRSQYRKRGIAGLVDGRGGGGSGATISEEAFELFKSMYLTQQQLSVKLCWQNVQFVNSRDERGWDVPSLRTMQQMVNERIPLAVRVLHREGLAAYEAKCAPYVQTDPDSVEPGQVWVGDHHQFNCWVRYRGRWVRPWLTAWLDMRSRKLVGWHISASPNQTTIMLAMKRGCERYGPPSACKIDNGKDYDSEMWTGTTKARRRALGKGYLDEQMVAGIYAMMDIAVTFSIPYHPQSKSIERFFDTADQQFTKTMRLYCGKDSARRPDEVNELLKRESEIQRAYTLDTFAEAFAEYARVYDKTAHTGRGMDGRSPDQVFAGRGTQRVLADGVLGLLLRVWSGELKVGKNGVRFKGLYYGQFNTELLLAQGRKVRLAYDPDDLRRVHVYDSATLKLLCIAEQNQLVAYGEPVAEENLRQAMKAKGRALKTVREYRDAGRIRNTDLTSLTIEAMAEAQDPQPTPARPQRLQPVRTAMDDQVAEHERQQIIKHVKRASGAEQTTEVLDFDFSKLRRTEPEKLTLKFNE